VFYGCSAACYVLLLLNNKLLKMVLGLNMFGGSRGKAVQATNDFRRIVVMLVLAQAAVVRGATVTVDTDAVRSAVDGMADGDVCLWNSGTGTLVQNWSKQGWGCEGFNDWGTCSGDTWSSGMFGGKAGTLQCTDVVTQCIIDAEATSTDMRRVMVLQDTGDVFLTGLAIRGGHAVSWGSASLQHES
jgi:hypothetical protein